MSVPVSIIITNRVGLTVLKRDPIKVAPEAHICVVLMGLV